MGQVKSIELDGPRVLVKFTVDKSIRLGDRTEAAIKTKSLLGTKMLEVTSRGDGQLEAPIPLDRTTSPYQLPDALGDLATTISGLNTNQLSESLRMLSQTFADTPPELKIAVEGVARFSQTLDERDAQLRGLLTNANKATTVLAERSDQVVSLIRNTNALLAELENQSAALDQISGNISALSPAAAGLHRREPRHAAARARQAQRCTDDLRQPQGTAAEVAQAARSVLDVAWRIGVIRPVLQDLRRQPAAGPIRAAVHRRRVLRPRSGPQRAAAFASVPTHRSASRGHRRCRCPTRGPGRAANRI